MQSDQSTSGRDGYTRMIDWVNDFFTCDFCGEQKKRDDSIVVNFTDSVWSIDLLFGYSFSLTKVTDVSCGDCIKEATREEIEDEE